MSGDTGRAGTSGRSFYRWLRPFLLALDPERAHRLVFHAGRLGAGLPGFGRFQRALFGFDHPSLHQRLWERKFPNPVGLAAGFDKDGELIEPLLGLGFGFLEVGTVTPRPQPGNARPRLFRLPEDGALINRMGFNNRGVLHAAALLDQLKSRPGPVGVNLGKNLATPLEEAVNDYLACLHAVYAFADYLAINVSSPNTPGLRDLQEKRSLAEIARAVCRERDTLRGAAGRWVPVLLKIAPDLSEAQLADVVEAALDGGADGLIATNTSTAREGLLGRHRDQAGGLSGTPLFPKALATVRQLHRLSGGKLPLIGVGGIGSPEDAFAFIRAGASLVQLYTGLIYHGPGLVHRIKQGLVHLLERDGFANVAEAVGTDATG